MVIKLFKSSCIGGPPIPGNYVHQTHLPHLVSAARRCQGTMVIKFIYIISYRRPANTKELWSSNYLNHLVLAGRRYQGTMFIKLIYLISYRQPADTRELWSSNSFTSSRIGGPPIPMEFRDIVLVTYIVSADCVSLSVDPIFFDLFRHPLSANRSLLSAGCLCTPFHTALQTQSFPRTQRRPAARSN